MNLIEKVAKFGVDGTAEILDIPKSDVFKELRQLIERRPQDSWQQACKRFLKENKKWG